VEFRRVLFRSIPSAPVPVPHRRTVRPRASCSPVWSLPWLSAPEHTRHRHDTHPTNIRYDTFEAVCTKREKAHEPGAPRTARAGGAPTHAARPHLEPRPGRGPGGTAAGPTDPGPTKPPRDPPTWAPVR